MLFNAVRYNVSARNLI